MAGSYVDREIEDLGADLGRQPFETMRLPPVAEINRDRDAARQVASITDLTRRGSWRL